MTKISGLHEAKNAIARQYKYLGMVAIGNDAFIGGDVLDIRNAGGVQIYLPTASSLAFQVSFDGETWFTLADDNGTLFLVFGDNNYARDLPEEAFGAGFLKIFDSNGIQSTCHVSVKG